MTTSNLVNLMDQKRANAYKQTVKAISVRAPRNKLIDYPSTSNSLQKTFVSALFTDINDHSRVIRNTSLHHAATILDDYYCKMLEASIPHGAIFEEYLGDGVYLSFQADTKEEAAESAIACATQMQVAFAELEQKWKSCCYPFNHNNYHNIGIASGYIFEGTVGHIQYRRRKLMGPTINLAAHLVQAGKTLGGSILIDEETNRLSSTQGQRKVFNRGDIKGFILEHTANSNDHRQKNRLEP